MKDYLLIETPEQLENFNSQISRSPRLGFDLEGDFDLYRYGRRICLFQISLDSPPFYVLDPLKLGRLTVLEECLKNPQVEKVIWGAQNDVRVLKEQLDCGIRNLVDLWEAARLSVHPRPSLPLLVEQFCGKSIVKSEELQTSDWNTRPLSEAQLDYAAQDVRYLLPLWDSLKAALSEAGRQRDFKNSMVHMEQLEFRTHEEPWMRLKGTGLLTPEQKEVLKAGYSFRDKAAREKNTAPWRLFRNEYLLEWAKAHDIWRLPQDVDPLEKEFYSQLNRCQELES